MSQGALEALATLRKDYENRGLCHVLEKGGDCSCPLCLIDTIREALGVDTGAPWSIGHAAFHHVPDIRAHQLRISTYGFIVVVDPTLPVSTFRLLNANGGGMEYRAEARTMHPLPGGG